MDQLDKQALRLLGKRGRATWAELGERLKLTGPSAAERVRKLEEQGIIRGFAAILDPEAVGLSLTAFIAVNLASHNDRDKFLKRISGIPEILECHHVAGEYDFLLKVRCRGTRELDRLLTEDLKGKAGAGRTHTTIALGTYKETVELPIE